MIQEQSPARLLQVRAKLYELIAHCIPADVILKNLVVGLLKMVDVGIKRDILKIASEYDFRLRVGVKSIFHLEAFVAKFFSVYKRYLNDVCDF